MDELGQLLRAECIVAVMGVKHAISTKPRPPSEIELRRAEKLPAVIKRRVAELVAAKKPAKQAEPPSLPKYRETHEALAKGVDQDLLVETMIGIPPELLPACTITWTKAVAYLNERFPRRIEQRLTGAFLHEPSRGEWAEFGWLWRLANDPLFAIDLAAESMLIGVEIAHLKAMFPSIYSEMCAGISDALAEQVAESKDWQAPWWLRKQLCNILGVSPVSASLVQDIDAAVKQSQAETKTRTGALKVNQTGETQSQKLAGGEHATA